MKKITLLDCISNRGHTLDIQPIIDKLNEIVEELHVKK